LTVAGSTFGGEEGFESVVWYVRRLRGKWESYTCSSARVIMVMQTRKSCIWRRIVVGWTSMF